MQAQIPVTQLNGDMQAQSEIKMRHLPAVYSKGPKGNGDMQAAKRLKMRHLPAVYRFKMRHLPAVDRFKRYVR